MSDVNQHVLWIIDVHGYGKFEFFGTEDEAEEMRAHKSNWEGGVGKKRHATDTEKRAYYGCGQSKP